ncbi:MAG: alpha/beta hydrolase [Burkholderiales bacterium]|nr:alpha/beta hydrolase [Burkholderiales bacterium]
MTPPPAADRADYDPDGQPPLPFAAADDYARTVMAWSREPLPESVAVARDLAYGAHRLQRYDVYAPRDARDAAVLVFWHGGGWTNGYRAYTAFMAPHVTALGMVLVAPSYRLTPAHALPAACADALAVLADLKRRLPEWGGAPDRVFLSGHSAGGHLAALTALRAAEAERAGVARMIAGCLPISGILDLHDPAPAPGSLEERVYTTVLRDCDPRLDTVLSPLYWTTGNRVPFALTYGERDSARAIRSNRRIHAMLAAQGAPVTCEERPGRDHFATHTDLRRGDDPWYARLATLARGAAA